MKKYILHIGVFLALLTAFSCDDKNNLIDGETGELEQVFSVSKLNGDIAADGAVVSFYVNSTQAWTISIPDDAKEWITVDKTSGKSSLTVLADVKMNKTNKPRTATLTITAEDGTTEEALVTQLAQWLYIDGDEIEAAYTGGEYPINVVAADTFEVVPSSPWITTMIDGDTLRITVEPNATPFNPVREGKVEVTCGDVTKTITVKQGQKILIYEEFLGTYTMRYTTSNNANSINRNRTATVTLEQAEQGETYYLKGILAPADEALGNIVVNYDEEKGLEIVGQRIFIRSSTDYSFWLTPYCQQPTLNAGNYTGTVNAAGTSLDIGMIAADFSSEGIGFVLKDNGYWPSSTASNTTYGPLRVAGFVLRNFEGTTNMGNVNGRDGQAFIYFPLFEKQ